MKTKITLLLAIACISCKEILSRHTLDAGQFVNIYVDLLQSKTKQGERLTAPGALEVLKSHGVSEEQFRKTMQEYDTDVDQWNEFYKQVVQQLEESDRKKAEP